MADLLVVDDDPDIADTLAEVLHALGHRVRVAHNGEEGLRLLLDWTPDLALLDVEMPVLDGPGMAYGMLVHDVGLEQVPIVLLSGVTDLRDVAAGVGTPYFLGKPYGLDAFIRVIDRALAERSPPHPGRPASPTPPGSWGLPR
jgi:DNA-binding response OmpR family regulator